MTTCAVPTCDTRHYCKGYCNRHYLRFRAHGDPCGGGPDRRRRGTGTIDVNGYRRLGQKFEHRLVMEQILGRPLRKGESVHHKNGDKTDNRPENLELWASHHPPGQRVEDMVAWAKEILARYG
jgi:hypothetical protein